ncbi:DinB family protein [Pseudooceanicola aestuarii]|uniref:DinB family protein n=1 Tax=Pseudooceanicola aestuarii TaxID=2697319 RepID=UPI0013D285D5|nr:DinB family protein [Pseudooceanicola aestuarii]
MITPDYCQTMARYNAWQNCRMQAAMAGLSEAALRADRGAFFGSILGTANHLLWGDAMWMSRFDGGARPQGGVADSPGLTPDLAAWWRDRQRMDARIDRWAATQTAAALAGDLRWYSGALSAEVTRPRGLCIAHMFNHQAHHRGQVHALLTAAGAAPADTDLFLIPDPTPAAPARPDSPPPG